MTMQTRPLGKTGLNASVIGMGCAMLGSSNTDYAVEMIRAAIERGVNYIDVARVYRDAEDKLGIALVDMRDRVILSTKTTAKTRDDAWRDIETSLAKLKTDYVDNLHLHGLGGKEDQDLRLGPGGALEAMIEMREQGITRHIGATAHRAENLVTALDRFPLEVILIPMNIVNRKPLEALIPLCRQRGVGVTVMKPLATGLLPARLALRWLLTQPVDCMVPGITTIDEALANAAVGHETEPLSGVEREQVEAEAEFWAHRRCQLCGECMPCEAGINLPGVLGTDVMYDHYRTMGPESFRGFMWSESAIEKDRPGREKTIAAIKACTDCGLCEERCPHQLPIREMLARQLPMMEDMLVAYDEITAAERAQP